MAKKERSANWGGARPGAGRKRKLSAREVEIMVKTAPEVGVLPPVPDLDSEPAPEVAGEMKGLALATLRQVMKYSPHDPSRVSAAKEVLARAALEDGGADVGKKAAKKARAAATARSDKFMIPDDDNYDYARSQ